MDLNEQRERNDVAFPKALAPLMNELPSVQPAQNHTFGATALRRRLYGLRSNSRAIPASAEASTKRPNPETVGTSRIEEPSATAAVLVRK